MLSLLPTAVQRLHDKTIQTTSIRTPIIVHYKPISCKNEVSFIYKPLITHERFLVVSIYVLPEDYPFDPQYVVNTSHTYIINKP